MAADLLDELNRDQERAYLLLRKRDYVEATKLFEKLFEQGVHAVAVHLGFIFSRAENPAYDREKAVHYYRVAAENNDANAAYGLGALLAKSGDRDGALKWFCEGSKLGHGTCSFWAFREFSARGDVKAADEFFIKALEQRNPAAIQRRSLQKMKGHFGVSGMLPGVLEYIGNMPRMARFIRDNVSRPADKQPRTS